MLVDIGNNIEFKYKYVYVLSIVIYFYFYISLFKNLIGFIFFVDGLGDYELVYK